MKKNLNAMHGNSVASVELGKATNAIEQFIYSCSHTLRSPLKSIQGLVYLLKNPDKFPEASAGEYLESISRTVNKMEVVLNDLEKFLSNSRQDISVHQIDLRGVLDSVLLDFQEQILIRDIKVVVKDHISACLYTDEARMRIILNHVLSNAIIFHDDQANKNKRIGVKLEVTRRSCTISIRDNGTGIHPDIMPKIFDLFYRGSERSVGSGVGLYVSREVIRKMCGDITIQSVMNRGTVVKLIFPNLTL